ncbi:MAG: adenylate/guanylate cyclase domain-containing protein [Chloroflexota bacterium]
MLTPPGSPQPRGVEGERRVITVLFCDVVNSTTLAGHFDPEEWAEIMNEAFHYMIAPIKEYDGMIARLMGDAVLAFFGAPQAHEDDPQRAVLAGLEIVNGIRPFCNRFAEDYDMEFNVRVGINTGPVVVGEIGSSQSQEYTAMGDAINLAARMEQTAIAGTVQISEDTYRLVAPLFDVWNLGNIEVKGKTDPIPAYRVLGVEPQPGHLRGIEGVQIPLVGRVREVGRLREILDKLQANQSQICFLIGEAGLGKSRLVTEVRREWRDTLAATHEVVGPLLHSWTEFLCVSFGSSRPYDTIKRQISQFCGIRDTDTPEVVQERLKRLSSLYPSGLQEHIQQAFGFLLSDMLTDYSPADPEEIRRSLLDVVEQMIRAQTELGPVVYVFDDLQWVDRATLETIRFLLPLVKSRQIMFLVAMRPDWKSAGWELFLETQMEYPEYCSSIYLEPLSSDESRAMIGEFLDPTGAPGPVYDLIMLKAEGNPFFIEETIRTLLEFDALERDNDKLRWVANTDLNQVTSLLTLPGNVQSLLTARIDQIDASVRHTLQLASVIGRLFQLSVLELIAEKPLADIEEHLTRLAHFDLVRPMGTGRDSEYAFRHMLIRDAAYETILIRQRRRYHRRVGEAIEKLFSDRLADEATRLAFHFKEGRDWAKAVYYYALAGEVVARLFANTEALEYYNEALRLTEAYPKAVDITQQADLYRRRSDLFSVLNRPDEALADKTKHSQLLN